MKTNTKALFCILATLLFLSTQEVKAIEQIRYNSGDITRPGSIIRHYSDGLDVVCYNNSEYPYFMIYKNGSATTYELLLQPMDTVCDFEIYNDTVYFCGVGNIQRAGCGVVGYFAVADLLTPNSTNVSYVPFPSMAYVKAIAVGWFASRKHVVGLGEAIDAKGRMVDMIDESAYWNVNFGYVGGDTILLSDLAITQSYVVVTSTKKTPSPFAYGRLWQFTKPTVAGASLFPCNVTFYDHGNDVGRKYLIKAMPGDNFVTAYQDGLIHGFMNPFVVTFFNGFSNYEIAVIDEGINTNVELGDVDYSMGSWAVDLLLNGSYRTNTGFILRSVIYEMPFGPLPATVKAHVYDSVIFESLDRQWAYNLDEQHFVSSGYKPGAYGTPYFLKYHSLVFDGKCLGNMTDAAENIELNYNKKNKNIDNTETLQVPMVIETYMKEMRIETECTSHTYPPVYKD